jgi:hypothetical protein
MTPPELSPAGHDMLYELHELKVTATQSGAPPAEVLGVELYNLAVTILSMADSEADQRDTLAFVLEQLPALVHQLQQAERWRRASRGCLEQ